MPTADTMSIHFKHSKSTKMSTAKLSAKDAQKLKLLKKDVRDLLRQQENMDLRRGHLFCNAAFVKKIVEASEFSSSGVLQVTAGTETKPVIQNHEWIACDMGNGWMVFVSAHEIGYEHISYRGLNVYGLREIGEAVKHFETRMHLNNAIVYKEKLISALYDKMYNPGLKAVDSAAETIPTKKAA